MGRLYNSHYDLPFFGCLTDVNIWSESFREIDISAYHNCKNIGRKEYGNIFNWRSSQYEVIGYITEDVDKQLICKNNSNVHEIIGFRTKSKAFNETVDFCEKVLSGQIATSIENVVLQEIEKEAKDLGIQSFFNGFIRNQPDTSIFVEYSSKRLMPSYSWMAGQPNNYGKNQNCVTKVVKEGLNDLECTTALNPICQVKSNTNFQLTGICKRVFADFDYTLVKVLYIVIFRLNTNIHKIFRANFFLDLQIPKFHGQMQVKDGN